MTWGTSAAGKTRASVEVAYGDNEWLWFVRGGPHDGEGYGTLEVARHYAEQSAAN